jgi:hypothetical protein
MFKLPRFYYNILSHHNRLDNTDKAALTKVNFRPEEERFKNLWNTEGVMSITTKYAC